MDHEGNQMHISGGWNKMEFFRTEFAWKTMKHEIYERAFLMAMPTASAAASCISYRDIRDGSYSAKNANSPFAYVRF